MHTPPVKSHTFYVSSSPTLSPSLTLQKSHSSVTRLPSLPSSTSLSTPSYSSLKNSSTPKLPWSSLGKTPDLTSRRGSESRRSVRFLDSGRGKDGRGSSLSSKKALDPAKVWARYTQTVRPQFQLYEPSRVRFGGEGGKGGRRLAVESEEDNKYVMKMSLPCPNHSGCCFCVYSRQLGPVRIYFSNFNKPKLRSGGRFPQKNGGSRNGDAQRDVSQEHDKKNKNRMVFLKEPWLTSSVPSGEVIVPDVPSDDDKHLSQRHVMSKYTPGELVSGRKIRKSQRNFVGKTISRSGERLRNSAPVEYTNHTTSSNLPRDSLGKLRYPKSLTFWDENLRTWSRNEPFLQVPRNTPRSLSMSSMNMGDKTSSRRDTRRRKMPVYDLLQGPPSFPNRDLSASVRLLSKRPAKL